MRPHRENLELDRNAPEISPEGAMGALRSDEATKLEANSYHHRFMLCLFRVWLISKHCFSTAETI